ncbi:helix-turn-helix domain-containing protein [Paracidobacterium acidisoli]|uniref:AraC family transcriptional regulator n=1 Tax=Paracidobacterium acidisoli TaxID=2303751 RepID=A0A372IS82_9BACT|nr:AraC family transcriptional regulator [Paracidobacterium acidisoli]MBT9330688.1 AraC family transcriptional regulator [Paracidobacterium acidisoli]
MNRLHHPAGPLGSLVKCFWYWEGAPQTHTKERLMPNGEPAIIFNLRNDPIRIYDSGDTDRYSTFGHAVLSGAHTRSFVIDTAQQDRVVGIQFHPGGSFPFFRMPASEFENTSLPLAGLWPSTANDLREQLLAAPNLDVIFALMERCLLEQLLRPPELHPAVHYARALFCREPHATTVSRVMDKTGLSQRRFIEIFRNQIGITPKAFCRVRRFQRVLETVHRVRQIDWTEVALNCGYYDQPHFIHDFQAFSGFTPTAYHARATEHLNHVPIA